LLSHYPLRADAGGTCVLKKNAGGALPDCQRSKNGRGWGGTAAVVGVLLTATNF
jgi:hypothetical protein